MTENTMIRKLTTDELLMVSGGSRMEACHARYLAPAVKWEYNKSFAQNLQNFANYALAYLGCVKEGDHGIP
jgi:hypothetical protein